MKISNAFRISVLFMLFGLLLPSCALPGIAPAATATPTPTLTRTVTLTPTITLTPTLTITPTTTPSSTPRPNLTATQLYEDFSSTIEELYDAGYISTTDGKYKRLADFPMELSKIDYYTWVKTGDSPTNFVISSDVTWESASAAADNSGCGFVFHLGESGYYVFYASLKGFVRLNARLNDRWTRFGGPAYGNPQQNGKVKLTLIVEGTIYRVLVDDQLIKTYQGFDGKLSRGELAYTVLSGTNKSYGTRCKFTNTGLWIFP